MKPARYIYKPERAAVPGLQPHNEYNGRWSQVGWYVMVEGSGNILVGTEPSGAVVPSRIDIYVPVMCYPGYSTELAVSAGETGSWPTHLYSVPYCRRQLYEKNGAMQGEGYIAWRCL